MDQNRHQQRLRNPASKQYQRNAQRKFDQEVGTLGRKKQNHQNEYSDLNTDFEIGNITTDLDAGLGTQYEIGELGFDDKGRHAQKGQRTRK